LEADLEGSLSPQAVRAIATNTKTTVNLLLNMKLLNYQQGRSPEREKGNNLGIKNLYGLILVLNITKW
jgi:hypothetical protein